MALLRLDGDVWSVIGGFVTYRLARKGGKETLERKFPARRLEKVITAVMAALSFILVSKRKKQAHR